MKKTTTAKRVVSSIATVTVLANRTDFRVYAVPLNKSGTETGDPPIAQETPTTKVFSGGWAGMAVLNLPRLRCYAVFLQLPRKKAKEVRRFMPLTDAEVIDTRKAVEPSNAATVVISCLYNKLDGSKPYAHTHVTVRSAATDEIVVDRETPGILVASGLRKNHGYIVSGTMLDGWDDLRFVKREFETLLLTSATESMNELGVNFYDYPEVTFYCHAFIQPTAQIPPQFVSNSFLLGAIVTLAPQGAPANLPIDAMVDPGTGTAVARPDTGSYSLRKRAAIPSINPANGNYQEQYVESQLPEPAQFPLYATRYSIEGLNFQYPANHPLNLEQFLIYVKVEFSDGTSGQACEVRARIRGMSNCYSFSTASTFGQNVAHLALILTAYYAIEVTAPVPGDSNYIYFKEVDFGRHTNLADLPPCSQPATPLVIVIDPENDKKFAGG